MLFEKLLNLIKTYIMHSRAYFALIRHVLLYWGHRTEGMGDRLSKQETLSQCYINVDPPSYAGPT